MRVFLDSCVILSRLPREIIIELARAKLIEITYSKSIEAEAMHVAKRKDMAQDIAATFVSLRLLAEPVDVETPIGIWLPDEDDRHVLAGAMASKADMLLTENLRDFPRAALVEHDIRALSPDQLISELWAEHGDVIESIVVAVDGVSKNTLKNAKLYKLAKRLSDKMIGQ